MGKLALEKPLAKPAKPVTAPNSDLGNTDFRSGPEPLQLLSSFAFKQTVPDVVSGLTDKLWQPMIQATLEQVGQTLLDWCWKAFEQRYGEQLKHLDTARALSSQLLDPQLSLQAKCTALLNVLETSTLTGGSITPYLDVARQLKTIFKGLQQPGPGVIKRGIDTLSNLLTLLDLPAAQHIAGKGTLSSVRDLLSGALDWAQMLQRLSNVSWDSPQAIVDGLLQSGALPTWVIDIIEQGQKLYETLSSRLTAIKHKGEQLQRLHGLLEQLNQATEIKAKFTALLTLLLDEDMLGLIEQYAPAAMGDGLKAFALFKNAMQDGGDQDSTGLRSTLLTMEHVTSQPFIDRLGSEAGAVGQLMAEPLSNVRAALRGSASQEAALNLLLGLTNPKKTWTDFLLESSREMLLLPQVQDLGASFASRFAWQAQAIKALYGVLDDTFWTQYKTAAWAQLPSLISDTALRDAQNKQSQLAIALAAASGIPGEHIQTVFTEVSRVCRSWGNDSWSEFLPKVTESVNSLLSVLVQHGQVLPTYVQTLLDIGLWAAKGITRLLMLHAVWKAKADDEVLGEATLALIRKAIEEYAGENAAWAFDKTMIWLPMLPPLYKVLGNLEPIKEGQRVQWLANLLMRLYSLPEAQKNKDIIWVRKQIEAKAEHWLGGIPAAMLSNAIVEEIKSKPGYDLTPMFTRAIQLQGLASYISDCFANVTNLLQGVDVMSGVHAILNPARVQVPGGQRPAYLRDPTTLNFVLPESHPQQPLSTTAQNIAPVAWGAGAGATFLGGILFTYFAYRSYRKGNQTPSQVDEELGMHLVPVHDENADVLLSTAIEDQPLNESPYKSPSVPLKPKSSHWKKTGPLAAMASVMFSASVFSAWQTYNALADNNAREKVNKLEALEALEAKAREDFYAGNTNTLPDDLTQFTEAISTDENFSDTPPITNTASEQTLNSELAERDPPAPDTLSERNFDHELPQGDQPAPKTESAPTVSSDSIPLTHFFKPKIDTYIIFPESKEQERIKKSIQTLKETNATLQSTISANTDKINEYKSWLKSPKDFGVYSPQNMHTHDTYQAEVKNLTDINLRHTEDIDYNEIVVAQLETESTNLEFRAADQREFITLLSTYITYYKEDIRLNVLLSKNQIDIAIFKAKLAKVEEDMKSTLTNENRMAPLLENALTYGISQLEILEKDYQGLLTKNTQLMELNYASLSRKYDELSVHYEKRHTLPDTVENSPFLKVSGTDVLSMTVRNDAKLTKDDESVKSYIGNVATEVLTAKVGAEDAKKVTLNDQFTVHLQTTLNFSTGGMNGMSQPKSEEKDYSLLGIALGEPYRKEETNIPSNKRVSQVTAHNINTPESVENALSNGQIRNSVSQRFSDDLGALKNNQEGEKKYITYANQQAGIVLLSNIENTEDPDKKNMSNLAAQGFLSPQPLKFKGKVVAGMIAYGTKEQLLLVNYEARTSFIHKKNHPNIGLWEFISPQLSVFDKDATPTADKSSPQTMSRKIGLIEIIDYPDNTNIQLGETSSLESDLWSAKIAQLKSNFDGYVFTTEEQSTAKWHEITKSMLQLAEFATLIALLFIPAAPQTILGIVAAVGFGVAVELAERTNMENTDQGVSYLTSQQAIDAGRLLMVLGVIPEIGFGRSALMKTGTDSVERLSIIYKQALKTIKAKSSLLKMTPQQKSVLAARNGVGDATFKERILPSGAPPEMAVINLQKETGVITSAEAALQGVTPGTFLRGSTKECTTPADLINLSPGSRVIFRSDDNAIIFSGFSLGDGKIAGINHPLIQSQLSNEWVVIDLADTNILTGSGTNWTLKTSQTRIKIVTEVEPQHILPNPVNNVAAIDTDSKSPAKTIEPIGKPPHPETPVLRTGVDMTDNNLLLTPPFDTVLKKLNADALIKAAMQSPPTRINLTLLDNIKHRLLRLDIGMTQIEYRLVYIWNESSTQSMNHIVIKAEKDGQIYVLDLFARRLGNLSIANIDEPLILTQAQWLQTYMTRPHEVVIIYKDVSSSRLASISFNRPIAFPAQGHTVTDGVELTTPQWYIRVKSPEYLIDTITRSASLQPDQAVILNALIDTLSERSTRSAQVSLDMLLTSPQTINTALHLRSVPKGHLVVLSDGNNHNHVMVSLGDGQFTTHRLDFVDPSFPMYSGQVASGQLEKKMINGKIGEFTITSGAINKETLTVDVFLGQGSTITLENHSVLTINIRNQPDDKSPLSEFLKMSVLEHLWNARGVLYKLDTSVSGPVTYLVASYLAQNESSSVAQALSNHLNKEVTHRNLRTKVITSYLPQTED